MTPQQETDEIMADPELLAMIWKSQEDIDAGRVVSWASVKERLRTVGGREVTIDEQIRNIVREEMPEMPEARASVGQWAFNLFSGVVVAALALDSILSHANAIPERLNRLESRSVSEITVIHPDRRLERVVEPWGGGL